MIDGMRVLRWVRDASLVFVAAVGVVLVIERPARSANDFSSFPAVGSFFGKAIEVCPAAVAPAACSPAGPALALFMQPTLVADGNFLGNDSFSIAGPPLGPHTTAHGQWNPTSSTEFVADYVFMLNSFPPDKNLPLASVRFRWSGIVVDKNTLQGYVNMYFQPPLAPTWNELLGNQFPVLPPAALSALTPPTGFVKDPSLCRTPGCPLVFKFTVGRVAPTL
jgi:hypothetical protein